MRRANLLSASPPSQLSLIGDDSLGVLDVDSEAGTSLATDIPAKIKPILDPSVIHPSLWRASQLAQQIGRAHV